MGYTIYNTHINHVYEIKYSTYIVNDTGKIRISLTRGLLKPNCVCVWEFKCNFERAIASILAAKLKNRNLYLHCSQQN